MNSGNKKTIRSILFDISYAILPLLILVVFILLTFFVNQLITSLCGVNSIHYGTPWPKNRIDDIIPLLPFFIYFYFLTFPIGIATFLYLAYLDKKTLFNIFLSMIIAFVISGIIYFFFQSRLIKPDFTPNNFTDHLLVYTWNSTNPTNNFPSQHCYMAIAVFIISFECRKKDMKLLFRLFAYAMSILIVLSTVFTKQHYLVDFVGSLFILLPLYIIVKKFDLGKYSEYFFEKLNKKIKLIFGKKSN